MPKGPRSLSLRRTWVFASGSHEAFEINWSKGILERQLENVKVDGIEKIDCSGVSETARLATPPRQEHLH